MQRSLFETHAHTYHPCTAPLSLLVNNLHLHNVSSCRLDLPA
jgi:hypothetical protein